MCQMLEYFVMISWIFQLLDCHIASISCFLSTALGIVFEGNAIAHDDIDYCEVIFIIGLDRPMKIPALEQCCKCFESITR